MKAANAREAALDESLREAREQIDDLRRQLSEAHAHRAADEGRLARQSGRASEAQAEAQAEAQGEAQGEPQGEPQAEVDGEADDEQLAAMGAAAAAADSFAASGASGEGAYGEPLPAMTVSKPHREVQRKKKAKKKKAKKKVAVAVAASPDGPVLYNRPRGRAPNGKVWSRTRGVWVDEGTAEEEEEEGGFDEGAFAGEGS